MWSRHVTLIAPPSSIRKQLPIGLVERFNEGYSWGILLAATCSTRPIILLLESCDRGDCRRLQRSLLVEMV